VVVGEGRGHARKTWAARGRRACATCSRQARAGHAVGRSALGRLARRWLLRWAGAACYTAGPRGAGLARLGRTPLGRTRWAGHAAQERGEGRRGAGGSRWAAGSHRRLSVDGIFPIFLYFLLLFSILYFMLFSFELKIKHKFADYVNAQPE
jgi:hypothetical protein